MKILVTGGAGFIGAHLVEALLNNDHEVCVIDNLSTGAMKNLEHLQNHPSLRVIVTDLTQFEELDEFVKNSDRIYHLAAAVGVKLIVEEPVQTIEKNIQGTDMILKLANKWRVPFIFTSTSEVYGKNPNAIFSESDDMVFGNTSHFRWSYAVSKAIDEFLILSYNRKYGLPTIILRLFNTVGPKQTSKYGMVVPSFVKQALTEHAITVYGDGSQTRTFCHVHDVVDTLIKIPEQKSAYGEVFNIGGDEEISISDLAARVKNILNSNASIEYIPYDQAYAIGFEDMMRRVPNIEKANRLIGYAPQRNLDKIISDVAEHYQNNPDFL